MIEGRQYITDNDELVGLIPASYALELQTPAIQYEEFHVVVISDRLSRYGIVVDQFVGQCELSVQSLDLWLGKV